MYNYAIKGHKFGQLAKIMFMHLRRIKMPSDLRKGTKSEALHRSFITDLITECEDYVIQNPVRLRMPMDLGYMQVLKFEYKAKDINHLNKYYGDDFAVVWAIHHMYKHVVLFNYIELKRKLFNFIEKTGMKDYLTELMPGDIFYLMENKYVNINGLGGFRERECHYTRTIPKKTCGMQRKESYGKLFMPQ